MPPQLVEVLQSARAEQVARRLRLGQGWKDLDLVADDGTGGPMDPERLSRAFRILARRLGVSARLHDLRHSAVTVGLGSGVPLVVVSKVAGHSSTAFTARVYAHLGADELRGTADAMARAHSGRDG
jgi:integrase